MRTTYCGAIVNELEEEGGNWEKSHSERDGLRRVQNIHDQRSDAHPFLIASSLLGGHGGEPKDYNDDVQYTGR
jgi:hypothetical protein